MNKLLALNRGEIAIRILRAANELGLRTVAVYSQEDRLALHRFKADEAYLIGEGKGPVEAYLDVDGIVALATEKGVDAIHPGYGFLSENPALPRACEQAGIAFIGPGAELLDLLGDKRAARQLAQRAGIPTVPGTEDPIGDLRQAERFARRIGFPLIVKAAFGGGGRGMRVVRSAAEFSERLAEARREAGAAFGNDAVFLERYVERARHIEVQILGDRAGNLLHLYERDCSVQRRHQKVVEVAPAVGLDDGIRRALAEAAVKLARAAGYYNAGTVEFLVDADSGAWYFIEVNPRIQVEHTVTEMVTGIDLVRCQIQVAQGLDLFGESMGLPPQEQIPLYGFALQCRITTEDPSNSFVPDYGKIHTYRSPAGFGIRLDGGSAYSGAVITPYYDSLLVKTTAWGREFRHACQRMDRGLREFRVRGVKTNIPFLENVVNHPDFQAGRVTTGWLEQTPELFRFERRKDRATKLLTYLGEVIVNQNPTVAGKPAPARIDMPPMPPRETTAPPAGTRQSLDAMGPQKFAEWTLSQKRLLLTDTTFRDAHQSLLATRVRTYDMLRIASFVAHRLHNLYSLEMWGGATFDVAMRFLHEDPWLRLRQLRDRIPNICFQMLLRASNAVGYTAYPDNAVEGFIREAAAQGIDIFRIFDSLNWLPNMKASMEAVRKTGKVCEAAVCYTGDILDPRRDKYSLEYYVKMARELERMGAHVLAIKDMAGLCKPYAAGKLVRTLRQEVAIPIHFHTHDTSGINAASVLKAAEAGVHVADGAIAAMSGTTSQPNLNSIVAALGNTPRDSGVDLDALNQCADYWETVRTYYAPFDTGPKSGSAEVYLHEMPGGQYTNLRGQARALGIDDARWPEVARAYADVNDMFGDIIKVTPTSKVVGDLALLMVTAGLSRRQVEDPDTEVAFPDSVVQFFRGELGQPYGGFPAALQKKILKGAQPLTVRPGASLPAVDLDAERQRIQQQLPRPVTDEDLASHLMYPRVWRDYARERAQHGDPESLPTPVFFYGMDPGQEISVDLERGKTLIVRYLASSEPHEDGTRTVFFELNGQPRSVRVADKAQVAQRPPARKIEAGNPNHVGAPMPGTVATVTVAPGAKVARGDILLTLEAMKMQTAVRAESDGEVAEVLAKPGQAVDVKDLLVVLR